MNEIINTNLIVNRKDKDSEFRNKINLPIEYDFSIISSPREPPSSSLESSSLTPPPTPLPSQSSNSTPRLPKKKNKTTKTRQNSNDNQSQISIYIFNCRYTIIPTIAKELSWKCVGPSDSWNICWTDQMLGVEFSSRMKRFQKINHFPGMLEICRKDLLARNLNRMLKLFPKEYQIFPKTWHLPADLGDALKFAKLNHRNGYTYILKPDQGAQGRGISLTRTLKHIKPHDHMICQLYINRPLLIDGFKFDLRIYTLITSIQPLRIYVHKEGLCRFATSKYHEPKGHNRTNIYMHLTNYSINKHSRTFCKDIESGSKRKLSILNEILKSRGHDVIKLWKDIDDIVVKTICSAYSVLKHNYQTSFPSHDTMQACFEILGIDIIIDESLKPWLLEVNHSPSFHLNGQVDKEVKTELIRDTLRIINLQHEIKKNIIEEDRKRVQTRLLKKVIEHRLLGNTTNERTPPHLNITNNTENKIIDDEAEKKKSLKQGEWEERHIGGFRRIFPSTLDPALTSLSKYERFLQIDGKEDSILADTVISKQREEASQMLRKLITAKQQLEAKLPKFVAPPIAPSTLIMKLSPKQLKKHKKLTLKLLNNRKSNNNYKNYNRGYTNNYISDIQERDRLLLLAQRDYLVKSTGIVDLIYNEFYENNLLKNKIDIERAKKIEIDNIFDIIHKS